MCLCFNGKLFRANTTHKTDSIRFVGFESLIPPFIYEDIQFFIDKSNEIPPKILQKQTTFDRFLSDKIAVVPVFGSMCKSLVLNLIKSEHIEGIIFDFPGGINLSSHATRFIFKTLKEKTEMTKNKIICILSNQKTTKSSDVKKDQYEQIQARNVHFLTGITRTALVQKLSMIVGSKKEFWNKNVILQALKINSAGENKNENFKINTQSDLKLFKLGKKICEKMSKFDESQKGVFLHDLEKRLVENEMIEAICGLAKFGLNFATFFDNKISAIQFLIETKSMDFVVSFFDAIGYVEFYDYRIGNQTMIALNSGKYDIAKYLKANGIYARAECNIVFECLKKFVHKNHFKKKC